MIKPCYNIAHVLPWSSVGGTENATLRIARAVEPGNFKSVAFCPADAAPVRAMFEAHGIETASYDAAEPSYRHPQNYLRASWQLAREYKRREVDLVHCADLQAAHHTGLAAKLAGLPLLCHIRNRHEDISRRDASFLRLVSKFVFVSQNTWQRFGYKVPTKRGTIVYDGFDANGAAGQAAKHEVCSEFGIPQNVKIVGMVARVAPQKDYQTLSRAAARVVATNPDVRFLIVGEYSKTQEHCEHYEEVQQMLRESGVAPYFIFTDFRQDVGRLIGAMDVFVLSTHFEGLPLVILEAMAQAKPVVATAVDGIPEIVINNQTGLLHEHEDDKELAEQLRIVLDDERHAAVLGEAGRRFVETNFNQHQFAANMIDLYCGMLGEKRERKLPNHEIRKAVNRVKGN